MTDIALNQQIPLAVISTIALQWLKKTKLFPWLTTETQHLNRLAGAVIAFLATVGVLVNFDHATGVLTISGLTAANLAHVGWRFVQQWAMQQAAYKTVITNTQPPKSS